MPSRRPTAGPRAKDLRTSWRLLPRLNSGITPMALSRPGFAIIATHQDEVLSWANRFPADFTDAWVAFLEANKEG
jgi:hypothetical protein